MQCIDLTLSPMADRGNSRGSHSSQKREADVINLLHDVEKDDIGASSHEYNKGSVDVDVQQIMEEEVIRTCQKESTRSKKIGVEDSEDVMGLLDALSKPSQSASVAAEVESHASKKRSHLNETAEEVSLINLENALLRDHLDGDVGPIASKQARTAPPPAIHGFETFNEGIQISMPSVKSKRDDSASARDLTKAIKKAQRDAEKVKKQTAKQHVHRLRVADSREVRDRANEQRDEFRAAQGRDKERAKAKSHAAKEITAVLRGAVEQAPQLLEALQEVGITICEQVGSGRHSSSSQSSPSSSSSSSSSDSDSASALGTGVSYVVKWAWRPSAHGGAFSPSELSGLCPQERRGKFLPFVTVIFSEDVFLELVCDDPACVEFRALTARIEALKRDLVEAEGLPDVCRVTLLLGNMNKVIATAVRRAKASAKKRKVDAQRAISKAQKEGSEAEVATAESALRAAVREEGGYTPGAYRVNINEAYAHLLIRHGIDVLSLPGEEEMVAHIVKTARLLGDQQHCEPIVDLDCVPKYKTRAVHAGRRRVNTSSQSLSQSQTQAQSMSETGDMEEFGGGIINPKEAQLEEKREQWINMLCVIDGMTRAKATCFVNTYSHGSCPFNLRRVLTDPRTGSAEVRRDSMAESFGSNKREIALSRKIFSMFTCKDGNSMPRDGGVGADALEGDNGSTMLEFLEGQQAGAYQ